MLSELHYAFDEANQTGGNLDIDIFLSALSISVAVGINKPENFVSIVKSTNYQFFLLLRES
jgi:hypothetical protein